MSFNERLALSVIMSVYNEPIDWLKQSIDSIFNQTYKNFEFIIICDNPNYKECIAILKEYEINDNRVRLIFNDKNIGLTKSLNKGLKIAKGKYIARMDADDISLPERLEQQLNYLETHPSVDVCGCNIRPFGNISMFTSKIKKHPEEHKDIVAYMYFDNPIAHPSVMIRRNINNWSFHYDETIKKAQDYYLWYDLFNHKAVFHNLQSVLLLYRISDIQISKTSASEQLRVADIIHEKMLSNMGVISDYNVKIHNEICHMEKGESTLEEKISYLVMFLKKTQALGQFDTFRYISTRYALLSYLIHNKPLYVLRFPFVRMSDIFSKWFIREFIKSLVGKR